MNPVSEAPPPQATLHTFFVSMKTILCLLSCASFNYLKTKKERVEDLRIGRAENIEFAEHLLTCVFCKTHG